MTFHLFQEDCYAASCLGRLSIAMSRGPRTKTLFLTMKLVAIFLLYMCLQVSANGFSQKINLSLKNAPLKTVFKEIEKQAGITFYYKEELLSRTKNLTVNLNNATLREALEISINRQQLSYVLIGKTVVVREAPPILRDKLNGGKSAAQYIITGTVSDEVEDNEASGLLQGASVVNKNSGRSVITDKNGVYRISATEGDVLLFSFVGHAERSVVISQDILSPGPSEAGQQMMKLNVQLKKVQTSLNEAVIIGYGTARKKDLTGSVSSIDGREIQDIPFLSFDNAMAGKAAGVQITKTDGTPGGAVRVRVRGSTSLLGGNDPLYVVDGVPVQVQSNFINPGFDVSSPVGNDVTGTGGVAAGMSTGFVNGLNYLGGLNPDDIESITILKDASSTAIYGSKAANGVVIITTKRGKKDSRPQIGFNYYSTLSRPVTPDVLDAAEYRLLLSEAAKNSFDYRTAQGLSISPTLNQIVNSPGTFFKNANTDWIKEVTRNTLAHNAEISVSGGSASSRYFSSISFTDMPGVIKGSEYQRISGKINLENEIGSKLRFVTNLVMGHISQDITNGAYTQALRARPDYTPYDSLGNYSSFAAVAASYEGFQNPVAMLTSLNNSKTFSLLGSVSAVYDLLPKLQFKSTASLNSQTYNQRNFTPSYLDIGSFYGNVANAGGIGSNSNSKLSNWFFENTLTYNNRWKDEHDLNIMVGTSYETRKYSFFTATASGFPDDNILNNLSSATTPLTTRGDDPSKPQSYLLSFYARANYSYRDKYLFTFTGRADGSSKFAPDNKFGYFPSGAIAWRVSNESFLKNVYWLSDLKLRASYGLVGTQNIGDQMYRTLYTPLAYGGSNALVPTQLGNASIKWETTREADFGIDAAFVNNRVQLTADYYNKTTDGALLSLPVAASTSYSTLLRNVVDIRNKGFELTVSADIIRTKDFRWSASANITYNTSRVTRISNRADLGQIGNLTGLEYNNVAIIEGQPLGLLKGMNVTGIISNEKELADYRAKLGLMAMYSYAYVSIGDPMFTLDTSRLASFGYSMPIFSDLIGEAAPKNFGGFSQTFGYKNFDLSLNFTFSTGGKLFWGDHVSSIRFTGTANANAVMLNRTTTEKFNPRQPRLLLGDQLIYNSSLSLFDASYLKLRSLNLTYRFNESPWMKRTGMQNLALFVSATNLFTISSYPGNDPETSDDPYSVAGGYFDVSNYPLVRSYSFGIKAMF